ncbi:MAG TPA: hypothetical protein VF855_02825 [Acidimicrobiales bacterium]
MFTTGSKLFFGATLLAIVGAIAYGGITDGELFGTVVLASAAVSFAFIGSVTLAFRDANAAAPLVKAGSAADAEGYSAQGPRISPSMWPLVGAFAVALVAIGLVTEPILFLLGVVALLVVTVEWSIQGWADRASDDLAHNSALRRRVMGPIEFPVLGVLGAGVVVFGFSRLMLAINKDAALVAFVVIAVVILLGAVLVAAKPQSSKTMATVLLAAGGLAMVGVGIWGIASGEREFHPHPAGEARPADDATNNVNAQSSAAAVIAVGDDGFTINGRDIDTVTLARSLWTSIILENGTAEPVRIYVDGIDTVVGEDGKLTAQETEFSSNFVGEDQSTLLTFRITRPGEYAFRVESESGAPQAAGTIVVP